MDEPTNDLDIQTLAILEDYLDHFSGIVVAVSHDRYFLDRIARRIFAFEGNGKISQYEGGFTDYQAAFARKSQDWPLQRKTDFSLAAGGGFSPHDRGEKNAVFVSSSENFGRGQGKPRGERKLKFSFKEQREWETIEDEIAGLEAVIAGLEGQIETASHDYEKLSELMEEKKGQEQALEEKMERWIYLNDLAERIGSQ